MSFANPKFVAPSITEKAFNCPHCGALAKQFWHNVLAEPMESDHVPVSLTPEGAENFASGMEDKKLQTSLREWARRVAKKLPFLDEKRRDPYGNDVYNLSLSKCFNCNDISIWISERLAYPTASNIIPPNPDLPDDAKFDYREAASIIEQSPRGAAALLRLAIQKLCVHLGGTGKNINDDIAKLVSNGLDQRVQRSLDIVRVTGNNAVHPGEMDLRDNREIAEKLFNLVNLIADIMISQPNQISSIYDSLPEGARDAVKKRDS